ncbi:four-carbon acid sugar kinase family protein [Rhodobacteraceae bacterium N5(2021)]|uniref:3-oxo-tetronate kinase n=1 Tax=Gymnodinialimonas phycosphaerae TaxID=2841589 RepID=A0A975YEV4_9RHOB|nr:3-oxo-tetronate kinase [Gymnodinialimonas phycosphaerae]MBY4894004.1 four-carbon acid sugar kinase family protein [Gymnodinialimonas phycosphaerae]
MLLGCIGDDFTGSSDLANTLAKQGMRTVQYTGVPNAAAVPEVQAGVVALKSRSIAVAEAVAQSRAALDWLLDQGCEQIFFKYCSTFDSTAEGNIGPVADALAEALTAHKVIVCPAFPGAGRSLYQGHLFVNDVLLNESGLQDHPLTPMTDPDIRRWLAPQSAHTVGHVPAADVFGGAARIADRLEEQNQAGHRLIVVDAIRDADLLEIGKAAKGLPLITGGSGVALGLPANFGCVPAPVPWTGQPGKAIALSGSCSKATRAQIVRHAQTNPTKEITAADVIDARLLPAEVAIWLLEAEGLPLAYSSADPAAVAKVQAQFGRQAASEALEHFFAEVARLCVERGVTRVITAGGETSGAIVEGLDLDALEIGPEIDPGVPALRARPDLVVALKSGNFGAEDFFTKADHILARPHV